MDLVLYILGASFTSYIPPLGVGAEYLWYFTGLAVRDLVHVLRASSEDIETLMRVLIEVAHYAASKYFNIAKVDKPYRGSTRAQSTVRVLWLTRRAKPYTLALRTLLLLHPTLENKLMDKVSQELKSCCASYIPLEDKNVASWVLERNLRNLRGGFIDDAMQLWVKAWITTYGYEPYPDTVYSQLVRELTRDSARTKYVQKLKEVIQRSRVQRYLVDSASVNVEEIAEQTVRVLASRVRHVPLPWLLDVVIFAEVRRRRRLGNI